MVCHLWRCRISTIHAVELVERLLKRQGESKGERCKTLNSLLIISSFLFEIKSPTRRISFSARFRKYTDLSPIRINLLFHKITFDKASLQIFDRFMETEVFICNFSICRSKYTQSCFVVFSWWMKS